MAYCGPRGIPRSTFLSWPVEDQDAALGWQAYEAARCRSCGHHPDEPARHLHVDVCLGCEQVQTMREAGLEQDRGSYLRWAAGTHGGCERCLADAAQT